MPKEPQNYFIYRNVNINSFRIGNDNKVHWCALSRHRCNVKLAEIHWEMLHLFLILSAILITSIYSHQTMKLGQSQNKCAINKRDPL